MKNPDTPRLICHELVAGGEHVAALAARAPADLKRELVTVVTQLLSLEHRAADLQTAFWLRTARVRQLERLLN